MAKTKAKTKNKIRKYITRSKLMLEIAKKNKISKPIAATVINTVLNGIISALKDGRRVEIRGLGSFEVRSYKAYQGRDPRTGEAITVRAKKLPFFKVGKIKKQIKKMNK